MNCQFSKQKQKTKKREKNEWRKICEKREKKKKRKKKREKERKKSERTWVPTATSKSNAKDDLISDLNRFRAMNAARELEDPMSQIRSLFSPLSPLSRHPARKLELLEGSGRLISRKETEDGGRSADSGRDGKSEKECVRGRGRGRGREGGRND